MFADPLTSNDLAILVNELHEVRDKWYHLGVQLKVQLHDLDAFQTQYNNNPDKCLLKMLSHWLTMTPPPPTWQRVVDALNSPSIGKPLIADKIRRTYCTDDVGTFSYTSLLLQNHEVDCNIHICRCSCS